VHITVLIIANILLAGFSLIKNHARYIGLFFGVKSLDLKSPAVVLPAERYFADTAVKVSP